MWGGRVQYDDGDGCLRITLESLLNLSVESLKGSHPSQSDLCDMYALDVQVLDVLQDQIGR